MEELSLSFMSPQLHVEHLLPLIKRNSGRSIWNFPPLLQKLPADNHLFLPHLVVAKLPCNFDFKMSAAFRIFIIVNSDCGIYKDTTSVDQLIFLILFLML